MPAAVISKKIKKRGYKKDEKRINRCSCGSCSRWDWSWRISDIPNGEMKTVDGYTCTVNEVAPPTPTPTPSPTPTPTHEPEEEKPEDKENTDGEIITGEGTESEQTDAEETPAPADNTVGNVEVQNNVVETGDENNIAAIVAVIVICLGAAGGILVYKKKKDTKSK